MSGVNNSHNNQTTHHLFDCVVLLFRFAIDKLLELLHSHNILISNVQTHVSSMLGGFVIKPLRFINIYIYMQLCVACCCCIVVVFL